MASKSLRYLIRKPVTRKVLWGTLDLALKSDDPAELRSAVITGTALLEVGLERLLKSRMRRLNSDDESAIFGSNGPLGGFASKIRLAFAFGIIGPVTRRDLATLNDIRNVFAHAPHHVTMKNNRLWQKVKGLRIVEAYTQHGSYLHESVRKRIKLRYRGAGVIEAITTYALMLCHDRPKRVLLPPTKGTFVGWKRGNTLRF
jgi:DNA-binding MltR family transcriptional regulator